MVGLISGDELEREVGFGDLLAVHERAVLRAQVLDEVVMVGAERDQRVTPRHGLRGPAYRRYDTTLRISASSDRIMPAPMTTDVSGFSATRTGRPVSRARR